MFEPVDGGDSQALAILMCVSQKYFPEIWQITLEL